ncbi:hypothetical protein Trco_003375 [Trichoderma cornu-damae]|uniref:non-specific serine/threonine protein kinase n=1 Tax=Trichoderma cornu-damae TaxID=654480 RepID=A0A9P8QR95_9HYPO|nr:hypothetical protein Trco_003375 [Trichoderma cornu-damae]
MDPTQLQIINNNPIVDDLHPFRTLFASACEGQGFVCSPDALEQLDDNNMRDLTLKLLLMLLRLRATRLLRSVRGSKNLFDDITQLASAAVCYDFNFDRVKPLFRTVLDDHADDFVVWCQIHKTVIESTPPPGSTLSCITLTSSMRNTSSIMKSSGFRRQADQVLKTQLGTPTIDIPKFRETLFASVPGLEAAADAVFRKCSEGDEPLFGQDGWRGWPFSNIIPKLEAFATGHRPSTLRQGRKLLLQPRRPPKGSVGKRSMDIGFVNNDFTHQLNMRRADKYCWSHVLVPGELQSNPAADTSTEAWISLAMYVQEVFSAQDTRRFVLAFTLCGPNMRLWEYDRVGGMASKQFSINEPRGGLEFVASVLGFLWIDEEGLGFDPTIVASGGKRFIEIQRDGRLERLIIDKLIVRSRCIAGRATTCWKAHREDDPQTPLVIKDSWQYPERDEEGSLIREATEKGVVNMARYYFHETVRVRGAKDEIQNAIRKGLDATGTAVDSSIISRIETRPNRVHRRVIVQDYGRPIYTASSAAELLAALESCIQGHESLWQAGFLHRDISINNVLIDEQGPPSRKGFLIDLDLAIRQQQDEASGAKGKMGTRAFMAIGLLLGERHCFMHDLESFFWVLLWICINYDGPSICVNQKKFDNWNYLGDRALAGAKQGVICDSPIFCRRAEENFTPFYEPLIPLMDRLRAVVFPDGHRWRRVNEGLYSAMREILRDENYH